MKKKIYYSKSDPWLLNLKFIEDFFLAKGNRGFDSLNLIKPNLYFKGSDYKNNF